MKALVTGAGGFVGPHLVEHLLAAGDEICALDLATGPDLADGEGWMERLQTERPDAVYHLAGWSDVGASWQAPIETFRVNALGTMSVLEAAVEAKVGRVLIVSSADVYGRVDVADLPLTEDQPPRPRSPYGVSKQAAEALGLQYHRAHDLEVVIVRPFNHVGPGQSTRFAASAFAAQIAEAERNGGGTVVHGDLTAARDLTDVRDVVRAYRLLVEYGAPGQIYNVCSGVATTMQDMLDALIAEASVPITTQVDPARLRPVELPILQGSPAKLEASTGWTRSVPLERTLRDVLDDARFPAATA
ncbi:MAG: GDP-mannose 4,6-dehydratase [Acidimicrobiales bacterium]